MISTVWPGLNNIISDWATFALQIAINIGGRGQRKTKTLFQVVHILHTTQSVLIRPQGIHPDEDYSQDSSET